PGFPARLVRLAGAFPAFALGGKRLALTGGSFSQLDVMNVDGTGRKTLLSGKNRGLFSLSWAHHGERIALSLGGVFQGPEAAGDWIVFASDRGGDFEVYLIRPDGSGLRKLVSGGGRNNHPHFSPDGKWVVFTSKRAGFSAEEISLPRQPQPYGELFAVRVDGTGLVRLTHNGFEEGTPAWGPALDVKASVEGRRGKAEDY